jgi:hypothetical protein
MTTAPMEPLLYSYGIVSCAYFIHSSFVFARSWGFHIIHSLSVRQIMFSLARIKVNNQPDIIQPQQLLQYFFCFIHRRNDENFTNVHRFLLCSAAIFYNIQPLFRYFSLSFLYKAKFKWHVLE